MGENFIPGIFSRQGLRNVNERVSTVTGLAGAAVATINTLREASQFIDNVQTLYDSASHIYVTPARVASTGTVGESSAAKRVQFTPDTKSAETPKISPAKSARDRPAYGPQVRLPFIAGQGWQKGAFTKGRVVRSRTGGRRKRRWRAMSGR